MELAQSSVAQASANLDNSMANLAYTEIKAPCDGKVIDRKIDPGQTLAAQFQTPELFVLGVDMDKEMYVYASVDEADIGEIRRAQETEQPVYFRVDAYPDELVHGTYQGDPSEFDRDAKCRHLSGGRDGGESGHEIAAGDDRES